MWDRFNRSSDIDKQNLQPLKKNLTNCLRNTVTIVALLLVHWLIWEEVIIISTSNKNIYQEHILAASFLTFDYITAIMTKTLTEPGRQAPMLWEIVHAHM